jgi:hypothetical protein
LYGIGADLYSMLAHTAYGGLLKQRKASLYSTGAHPQNKISAKSNPGESCQHGPWHPSWAPPESSKSCAWGVCPWCVAPLAVQAALGAQPGGGKPCGGCAYTHTDFTHTQPFVPTGLNSTSQDAPIQDKGACLDRTGACLHSKETRSYSTRDLPIQHKDLLRQHRGLFIQDKG